MMRQEVLLTVVIPVYNVERYLKRCIESILIQGWKNYDILLVDDGSMDSSPHICDEYAENYDFVSVIHKENGGLSDARNVGIAYARGEYVYFPDSDDWIEPNTFRELGNIIETQRFDIISFNREFVKGEDALINPEPKKIQELSGKSAYIEMLKHSHITGFANDKIYRKSLFTNNGIEFPFGQYYEDLAINYKLFLTSKEVYATNQKYYYYLINNPDSITQSWNEQKFCDMFGFYKEQFYSDFVRSRLDDQDLEILHLYYVDGLTHILSSLYKSTLYKKHANILEEIKQELMKNKISLFKMKNQPNFGKYLLHRLGLLKFTFRIQGNIRKII